MSNETPSDDDTESILDEMVRDGDATRVVGPNGEPMFCLTEQGLKKAAALVKNNAEARNLFRELKAKGPN